ncbi:uncharacterized protein LOC117317377 [Pecten maximus]|uniref:uncharacterized protein LOC117317377 n=1 Tax=Pecten maximus TaxID=6579 RepID=UPI0014589692|nr:uncharacterized protein LOC117317377 [Pecten maximus]
MSVVPSIFKILTLCSALSLLTGVTSCNCPEDECMRIANTRKRCECCVFVFLGKRSGGPSNSEFSREDPSDHITNKRTPQSASSLYVVLTDLASSSQNNEFNGHTSTYQDRTAASSPMVQRYVPRVFGEYFNDRSGLFRHITETSNMA